MKKISCFILSVSLVLFFGLPEQADAERIYGYTSTGEWVPFSVQSDGTLEVNSNVTVNENNSVIVDDEGDTENIAVNQTYDSAVLSLAEGDTHQWNIGSNCNGTGGPGCTEIDITPVGGTVHHAFGDASVSSDTFTMPIINSSSFEETNKDAEYLEVYNPTDGSGAVEVYVRTWD